MNVNCPSCHRFYNEPNYSPGGVRKCPHCNEILYLPMEVVPEAFLVPLEGEAAGNRIALTAHMVIGRSKECEIHVQDQTLSRQHAEIGFDKGDFVLTDMGSRNGVQVNELRVGDARLRHLDVIRMGARSWRFEMANQVVPERVKQGIGAPRHVGPHADEHMGTVDMPAEEATVMVDLNADQLFKEAGLAPPAPHVPNVQAKSEVKPPAPPPRAAPQPLLVPIPDDEPVPIKAAPPPPPAPAPPAPTPLPPPPPAPLPPAPLPPVPPPAPPGPPKPKLDIRSKNDKKPEPEPPKGDALAEQTIRYEVPTKREAMLADLTYMCAEIRGFAQIAESLEPPEVVDLINQYLAFLVGLLRRHGATVDRFTGNSLRAFWGALSPQPDDMLRAVKCGMALQAELVQFNRLVSPGGQHKVELCIAFHGGEAVAGSLGFEQHYDFTVVGEVLSVTHRLQELTRPGQVLITQSLQRKLKDQLKLLLLPAVELRGRSGPIAVFMVQGLTGK